MIDFEDYNNIKYNLMKIHSFITLPQPTLPITPTPTALVRCPIRKSHPFSFWKPSHFCTKVQKHSISASFLKDLRRYHP